MQGTEQQKLISDCKAIWIFALLLHLLTLVATLLQLLHAPVWVFNVRDEQACTIKERANSLDVVSGYFNAVSTLLHFGSLLYWKAYTFPLVHCLLQTLAATAVILSLLHLSTLIQPASSLNSRSNVRVLLNALLSALPVGLQSSHCIVRDAELYRKLLKE